MNQNNLNINYFSRSDYVNLKPFSTANLISFLNPSSASYLTNENSVEGAITFLNNFGKYWWRKVEINYSVKKEQGVVQIYDDEYKKVIYGDELYLNSCFQFDVKSKQNYTGTINQILNFCQNNLIGKYVSSNGLYWCKATSFELKRDDVDYIKCIGEVSSINTFSLSPASYVYSENEQQYIGGEEENRFLYEKIENLYKSFQNSAKIEKTSYVGTGQFQSRLGNSYYVNVTFSFTPSLVVVYPINGSSSTFLIGSQKSGIRTIFQRTSSANASNIIVNNNQVFIDPVQWNYFNAKDVTYVVIAIG